MSFPSWRCRSQTLCILTLLCELVSQERFTIIHSSGFAQSQSPRHFEQPSGAKDLLFADVKESGSPSRLESTQNGNFIYPGEISDTRGQLLSANWGRIPKAVHPATVAISWCLRGGFPASLCSTSFIARLAAVIAPPVDDCGPSESVFAKKIRSNGSRTSGWVCV